MSGKESNEIDNLLHTLFEDKGRVNDVRASLSAQMELAKRGAKEYFFDSKNIDKLAKSLELVESVSFLSKEEREKIEESVKKIRENVSPYGKIKKIDDLKNPEIFLKFSEQLRTIALKLGIKEINGVREETTWDILYEMYNDAVNKDNFTIIRDIFSRADVEQKKWIKEITLEFFGNESYISFLDDYLENRKLEMGKIKKTKLWILLEEMGIGNEVVVPKEEE